MRWIRFCAVAVVAASAGAVNAQGAAEHGRMPAGQVRMDPLAQLLEKRVELGLTADQVRRLEAIHGRVQSRNQPIREQLQAARRQTGLPEPRPGARGGERVRPTEEQREARRRFRDQARPLMDQLRDNTRAAMREAREVLTDQQRQQIRRMHDRQGHGQRGHGRRGGRRGGGFGHRG
jgi:hypothetical protein